MKIIFGIAKAELKKMFFSPVAWLIIVIFIFQAALSFVPLFGEYVHSQALGMKAYGITNTVYANLFFGLFPGLSRYLYFYIPLLTMGLMSREFNSGSIKLLYSSPITNAQIIFGKYLSVMAFGLILVLLAAIFAVFGVATIHHVDIPLILCGLLGLFLLICAYGAIGLFMSALTQYMVVAAIGTFAAFFLLNYLKGVGQDIPLVRDITYWIALSGRSDTFFNGMITTEDLLYFIIVVGLFLTLTILRLNAARQKLSGWTNMGKYSIVILIALVAGYISALPTMKKYVDLTATKVNTLTLPSQKIIGKIPEGTKITTYTNVFDPRYYYTSPDAYKQDVERFDNYLRFKPTLHMEYVYYYHYTDNKYINEKFSALNDKQKFDTLKQLYDWHFDILPYKDISAQVDLSNEGFRNVRVIETPNGKRAFLRFFDDPQYVPNESEISAAFSRLIDTIPVVGFLTGQSERSTSDITDRGYSMFTQDKTFRYSLINQGFDFTNVTLDKPIAPSISILVIADMKRGLDSNEKQHLNDYISSGRNLLILGEPTRQASMNEVTSSIGVRFLPGILAHAPSRTIQTLVVSKITPEGSAQSKFLEDIDKYNLRLTMPGACAMAIDSVYGLKSSVWFATARDSCWSELQTTDFIDDTARFNPDKGEYNAEFPVVSALSRQINGHQQKIVVTGDADWLSNVELGTNRKEIASGNYNLINGIFSYFTAGYLPVDMHRPIPPDDGIRVTKKNWPVWSVVLKWVIPGMLAIMGTLILLRRKRR